jgi:malate dehydrogenase
MATVAIIGAGALGGAAARALASGDRIAGVMLVDDAAAAAAGKALDIQQAGAVAPFHTKLEGTSDVSRIAGCSVCVIADRFGHEADEWQGDAGVAALSRLIPYLGNAALVFAGASQAHLLLLAARELGVGRERLIGSAPEAFVAAITAIVAAEARCSPSEVRLTVLGVPPHQLVVPWSEASIGGYALDRVLTQTQLARLESRTARLWPLGSYAMGAAAALVARALVESSRRSLSVLTVLGGEFGVRGRVGAVPAILSDGGIARTRVPSLNTRERVMLETALGA